MLLVEPKIVPQKWPKNCVQIDKKGICYQKSLNGDTLGPVELNVWPEHPNQGERHEQDDQGEVSIIIIWNEWVIRISKI